MTDDILAEGAEWLAQREPRFAFALSATGPLPLRNRADGFDALLNAIVSQQLEAVGAQVTSVLLHRRQQLSVQDTLRDIPIRVKDEILDFVIELWRGV